MGYRIAADLVVVLHLAFVVFAVLGGLLAFRWPRVLWLQVPAAAWGALIELAGWVCPLTPLENRLRAAGSGAAYSGGFVEHYLLPVLYPRDLTPAVQLVLGGLVVALNATVYAALWARCARRRRSA